MKEYNVTRIDGAPVWEDIDSVEIGNRYLETPDGIEAFAQVAYDDERLYVHLFAIEADIRAVGTAPTDAPCEDSCLEFFFCPEENDTRYINIEFNPNGCFYLGFGSNVQNLVRLLPEEKDIFSPQINRTEDGWEIFYTVPYTLIRRFFPDFEMKAGKTMRANFYKCADLTTPPHYLSWNKIEGEPFTFHKQHCFGLIKF